MLELASVVKAVSTSALGSVATVFSLAQLVQTDTEACSVVLWALSPRSLDVPTAPAAQHLALVLDHTDTPDLTLEDTTRE